MLSYSPSNRPIAAIKKEYPDPHIEVVYYHDKFDPAHYKRPDREDYIMPDDFSIGNGQKAGNRKQHTQKFQVGLYNDDYNHVAEESEYNDLFERANNDIEERMKKSIKIYNGSIQPLPRDEEGQRQCALISGCSGSGKSTYARNYIKAYHAMFPKNRVIIISKKRDDPAFDDLKYITRLIIDEELINEKLDTDDFEHSLVVFDDIENITPAAVKTEVYRLKDSLIETGRSKDIYVLLCTHLSMNGSETRKDLNESDTVVVFPQNSSHYQMNRLLSIYCGLDKNQIKKILNVPSRWVTVYKHAPRHVITENEVFLL